MDKLFFLSSFLYSIRYKLIIGSAIALFLAVYLTSFIPKNFVVSTTIFTGITSKAALDDMDGRSDWTASNNAHENIINIVKSKSALQNVSIKLLAQHLMYGTADSDTYLYASNYERLMQIVPEKVLKLVDKDSFEKTVQNLTDYRAEVRTNFVYEIFTWDNMYYGFLDLSRIKVIRKGNSDMIEISYECNDPYIATSTVKFLIEEVTSSYENLLLRASNDVVRHFEEQLKLVKEKLNRSEDSLVDFNIKHGIINYEEQTKHLSSLHNVIESRYEQALLSFNSSRALVEKLEAEMDTRAKLMLENELFLRSLSNISEISGKIAEIEIFNSSEDTDELLKKHKKDLTTSEEQIKRISEQINTYKYSKEGVAITSMVDNWLEAVLEYERSKAELAIMDERKVEMKKQFEFYSPVGPSLSRQQRNIRVDEEEYLTILHHLGLAKLKQKNILLDAGTLQTLTPPSIPLLVIPRKRKLYVMAAFIASLFFITGFYLVIELLDRTLKNGPRTERLIREKVIGAFPSDSRIRHRRFNEEIRRKALSHLLLALNKHILSNKQLIVNLLSMEKRSGKTFLREYLENGWADQGFSTVSISHEDYLKQDTKEFLQAQALNDIPQLRETIKGADIVIVEYGALNLSSIPPALLTNPNTINLLVLNAKQTWSFNNSALFKEQLSFVGKDKLLIYLNNCDREATEYYTGLLPPYTPLRKLIYRLKNFGLSSLS